MAIDTNRRPAVVPLDTLEKHLAASVGILNVVAVIEDPILSLIVGDDLRVVARALDRIIAREKDLVVVIKHLAARTIDIRAIERAAAANDRLVGAIQPLAAAARRGEEVVITVALVDVGSLVGRARDTGAVEGIV